MNRPSPSGRATTPGLPPPQRAAAPTLAARDATWATSQVHHQDAGGDDGQPAHALGDPAPGFLAAFRGYNRQQVDEWVRWQQEQLASARQRAVAAEMELRKLRAEFEAATLTTDRLLPRPSGASTRRPRHLRRSPRLEPETPLGEAAWSLPASQPSLAPSVGRRDASERTGGPGRTRPSQLALHPSGSGDARAQPPVPESVRHFAASQGFGTAT